MMECVNTHNLNLLKSTHVIMQDTKPARTNSVKILLNNFINLKANLVIFH